jgi:hypothetical protein
LGFNRLVNLRHQKNGFVQGNSSLLVVLDVFAGKLTVFAVFETILADLIAADMKFPDRFRPARL